MRCAFGVPSVTRAALTILPEWLWWAPVEMIIHFVAWIDPNLGDCIYMLKLSRLFMVAGTNCLILTSPQKYGATVFFLL